jgi:prepilin peptidase CpaA
MIRDALLLGLFPAAMIFAAVSDFMTMKISNRLTLALAAAFFIVAMMIGMPWSQVGYHVLASIVVLVAAFGFFAAGWIGGGDAKLAAATALWFGFPHLLSYLLLAAIIGGVLTLFILRARAYPLPVTLQTLPWVQRLHEARNGIPYGVALAAGALITYPHTEFMRVLGG